MAIDSTVELYAPTITYASDGTPKKAWDYTSPNDTFTADVQPKSLNEAQIKEWGIDISSQDAKAVFDFNYNESSVASSCWKIADRARIDGDNIYRIMAVNPWGTHIEAILVPLVGT
jgi:hypothetical protein